MVRGHQRHHAMSSSRLISLVISYRTAPHHGEAQSRCSEVGKRPCHGRQVRRAGSDSRIERCIYHCVVPAQSPQYLTVTALSSDRFQCPAGGCFSSCCWRTRARRSPARWGCRWRWTWRHQVPRTSRRLAPRQSPPISHCSKAVRRLAGRFLPKLGGTVRCRLFRRHGVLTAWFPGCGEARPTACRRPAYTAP